MHTFRDALRWIGRCRTRVQAAAMGCMEVAALVAAVCGGGTMNEIRETKPEIDFGQMLINALWNSDFVREDERGGAVLDLSDRLAAQRAAACFLAEITEVASPKVSLDGIVKVTMGPMHTVSRP